jgi:hypothetical protein
LQSVTKVFTLENPLARITSGVAKSAQVTAAARSSAPGNSPIERVRHGVPFMQPCDRDWDPSAAIQDRPRHYQYQGWVTTHERGVEAQRIKAARRKLDELPKW